ncbi:MAG: MFS transporter [Holosporales bacterium]
MSIDEIDRKRLKKGFTMWLCAALFYGFQFIIRVSPSVMADDLMAALSLDACFLGTLASFYYYGYSFMQIPAGVLLDLIGPRRPLALACFLCAIGCFMFASGASPILLGFGRLMMGIGSAFGILTCIKIASMWFPAHRITLFVGLALVVGTTGATAGGAPLSSLVKLTDWRTAIQILGGFSALLTVFSWAVVRDHGPYLTRADHGTNPLRSVLDSVFEIVRNPQTWIYGAYGFLMYVPLSGFADLWGIPYLSQTYGVDRTVAAGAISFFYVGVGVGSPTWSFVLTHLQSFRQTLILSAILTLTLFTVIIYVSVPFSWIYVLYFLAGLVSSGQFVAFGAVAEINPKTRTATASGTHNMLCMISGTLLQPIIGKVLDTLWDGTMVDGARVYSTEAFHYALAIIPASLVVAALLVYSLNEVYPKEAPQAA